MKIWRLDRKGCGGYDVYYGFIIRAKSPRAARKIVVEYTRDSSWFDLGFAVCAVVKTEGKPAVILENFLSSG